MKTLRFIFFFISIYATIVGCSSKKDPVAAVACYLATSTDVEGSYNSVTTYTYTDNKVTSSSSTNSNGSTSTTSFGYDSEGKISTVSSSYTSGGSTSTDNIAVTYDANKRIAQMASPSHKTVYTYNSSSQVVKEEFYSGSNSTYTLDSYYTYDYPSTSTKNYSTQKDYNASNVLQATITFSYDSKQNPEAVVFPNINLQTNNVTQETYQFPGSTPSVVTYAFTYNANGFPISVTESNSGNTYTTAYTYTNCK